MELIICVFLPFLGAFLLPLLGRRSDRLRNYAALFMVLAALGAMAALLAQFKVEIVREKDDDAPQKDDGAPKN